jgi:hypothetical protein
LVWGGGLISRPFPPGAGGGLGTVLADGGGPVYPPECPGFPPPFCP